MRFSNSTASVFFVWLCFFLIAVQWLTVPMQFLTFCAKMIAYDSFIWFCAIMFYLCLLRNDLLLLRSTGLSAVWATTARSHRQKNELFYFFKSGERAHKFNNFVISKRTAPWRRSSKWRKMGAQGNIRILRSRNMWGQQRECKREKTI